MRVRGVLEIWPLDSPDAGRGRAYAALVVDEAAMVLNSWTSLAQHPTHAYRPAGEVSSELVCLFCPKCVALPRC